MDYSATVAKISDWLYYIGWDRLGTSAQVWAVIMLLTASLLGLAMAMMRRDVGYLAVLARAYIGIAVKQTSAPLVVVSACMAAALILSLVIYSCIGHSTAHLPVLD